MPSQQETEGIRLQKVLAAAGVGSRRACEVLIDEGRVEINGRVVTDQGVRVDPASVRITVDGERIPVAPGLVTLAFNKPTGVVCTMSDEQGRRCLADFTAGRKERLFHVGRLDTDTSGLLLLTNDGVLAQRLAHPSFGVPKTYVATVRGRVPKAAIAELRDGVALDDGPARCDHVRIAQQAENRTMVELTISEGRNRIVRRMFEAIGYPVTALVRTKVGPISLGQLQPGVMRELGGVELGSLYTAVDL